MLKQAQKSADTAPDYLATADMAMTILGDKELGKELLSEAEDRVTSLGEMKKVATIINEGFADDTDWVAQINEKLEKREANQDKYNEFQKVEDKATSLIHYLNLADTVMADLDDKFYTKKLLTTAEKILNDESFNFNKYRDLIIAINNHIEDAEWATTLYNYSFDQCANFMASRQVCHSVVTDIADKTVGKTLASGYYKKIEEGIASADSKSTYDYSKLAGAIVEDLDDQDWAKSILKQAEELASSHYEFAHLSLMSNKLGDAESASALNDKAIAACASAAQCVQLARRMKADEVEADVIKSTYAKGKDKLQNNIEKIQWVEGVIDVLGDKDWAGEIYQQLAGEMSEANDKAMLSNSKRTHLKMALS